MTSKLPTQYQKYIHLSRYSRWLPDQKRRETWEETVTRYVNFFKNRYPKKKNIPWKAIHTAILHLDVMPSMRCLMTAGPALDRDNVAGYNCAYLSIDRKGAFDEIMYLLMCGTGVGFSVERQSIMKLPIIAEVFHESPTTITVNDSKLGWAAAFRELLSLLYAGQIPKWDLSKVRPAGAPLKTFGGRASGPGPLEDLFRFACSLFKGAAGRRLTSLEAHDLICKTAEIVVVGGVRRSALLSLSNLSDDRMRNAKTGDWWAASPHRALANNSVAYTEVPEMGSYLKEMVSLYESKSGERGIFNRAGAQKHIARFERRDAKRDFGTNPCSEIILRDRQLCNLTEAIIRADDGLQRIKQKVRIAAILGTLQASLTDFRYVSARWRENTEEEALLGVSLTGIMDNKLMQDPMPETLEMLRKLAVSVNKEFAKMIGVNAATAVTCVKPSGTVSQLVDASSGIHGRFSPYYVRTVRNSVGDPLTAFMKAQGVPNEPVVGSEATQTLFKFPMKAPPGSLLANELSAVQQLETWKLYATHWCEHKPSVTVYVKEHEWPDIIAWVWTNFDLVSGVSFLPYTDHIYQQAPYQPISKEEFDKAAAAMPNIDWTTLAQYEIEDTTKATKELACTANSCDI